MKIKELISKLEEKHSVILEEYNHFNSLYNQDNPEFLSFYRTRMKDILEIINDLKEIEDSSLADLRNKLNPINNLIIMIENGLMKGTIETNQLIFNEIKPSKESIRYLSEK